MDNNQLINVQQQLTTNLNNALADAQAVIHRSYLEKLNELCVIQPESEIEDIDIVTCGRFFHLKRLVTDKDENFLDKLVTVANAVSPIGCSLTTVVESNGSEVNYYIGVVAKHTRMNNERDNAIREAVAGALSQAVIGNFCGSDLSPLDHCAIDNLRSRLFMLNKRDTAGSQPDTALFETKPSIASVSGIVSLRNKDDRKIDSYVQGLENLTNALSGTKYVIIMIADPVKNEQLYEVKKAYERIYSGLTYFKGCSITLGNSETLALSQAQTKAVTEGISSGVTASQFNNINKSITNSESYGSNAGLSVGPPFLTVSASGSYGQAESKTTGEAQGKSAATTITLSRADYDALMRSVAISSQTNKSMQISMEDRSVKSLLNEIDLYLERLNVAQNYGAFNCATYVLGGSKEVALTVAGHYNALMRGDDSYAQVSHINVWTYNNTTNNKFHNLEDEHSKNTELISLYLQKFSHPQFKFKELISVNPSTLVSGKELAIQFALPKKSIRGLTVLEMASFGRNIPVSNEDGEKINLGLLYHMGKEEEGVSNLVPLNVQNLAAHTFIAGTTKSGKSHTLYYMLSELNKKGIPFLVIEPTKGEYKDVFWDAAIFGTNSSETQLLQLNPFAFPPRKISVYEHIDRLLEVFNACWPMYATLPAILKDAIERAYRNTGWNLIESYNEKKTFPTFKDVLSAVDDAVKSIGYSKDTRDDFQGGLRARIRDLTEGIFGPIFTEKNTPGEILFSRNRNTIVDLSGVGSETTKSLIMGMLVLKLQEYRKATAKKHNVSLCHVTVLEEAHHLLRRTSMDQVQESSNLMGMSVKMLANSIAEMRTYGEGFIIADQSPGLLDMSVIRNTNTKIIMKLPHEDDRCLTGKSIGLNDKQIVELARLEQRVAAVYQSEWPEAVLCKINNFSTIDYKSGLRKLIEFIAGYNQTLNNLTDEEKMRLCRWRDGLTAQKSVLNLVDKALKKERLAQAKAADLLYLLFDGKSLTRFIQHENLFDGVKEIDESIIEKFGYEGFDLKVGHIRNLLLLALYKISGISETVRQRIEAVLQERGRFNWKEADVKTK